MDEETLRNRCEEKHTGFFWRNYYTAFAWMTSQIQMNRYSESHEMSDSSVLSQNSEGCDCEDCSCTCYDRSDSIDELEISNDDSAEEENIQNSPASEDEWCDQEVFIEDGIDGKEFTEKEVNENENMELDDEASEMSPEMVEFFRITKEHQQKRDALKAAVKRNSNQLVSDDVMMGNAFESDSKNDPWYSYNQEEFVVASEMLTDEKCKRTICTPNVKAENEMRMREMKMLYGDEAEKISAMETATLLNYENVASKRNAVLWPNIPLNIHGYFS